MLDIIDTPSNIHIRNEKPSASSYYHRPPTLAFSLQFLFFSSNYSTMGLAVGMFGAFSGFGIAMMTNATRKIPLSRGETRFFHSPRRDAIDSFD
jgi:hypothetical protein